MQGQNTEKTNNVVSLFESRQKKAAQATEDTAAPAVQVEGEEAFDDVITKNMKNKERIEKERASANKSVLRSYRIKH